MAHAAEMQVPDFITRDDLLKRPRETGLAVDPEHPYEIDDAIAVTPIQANKGLYRVKVHVADGGLLLGSDALYGARYLGWSEYPDDGEVTTMLPAAIALHGLSLNTDHYQTGTAPAVTVAFTFSSKDRSFHEVDIYKSRLTCQTMSYTEFEAADAAGDPVVKQVIRRAGKLNARRGRQTNIPRHERPRTVVSQYMVAANVLIAREMKKRELPWLFRNHHLRDRPHPDADTLRHLYPDSELFAQHDMAWYGRTPTVHDGLNKPTYCHFTSPLRRFPDLVNHLTLHASLEELPLPYDEAEIDEIAAEMAEKVKAGLGKTALQFTRSA